MPPDGAGKVLGTIRVVIQRPSHSNDENSTPFASTMRDGSSTEGLVTLMKSGTDCCTILSTGIGHCGGTSRGSPSGVYTQRFTPSS